MSHSEINHFAKKVTSKIVIFDIGDFFEVTAFQSDRFLSDTFCEVTTFRIHFVIHFEINFIR